MHAFMFPHSRAFLVLIDEVHGLREDRGATLEAVVSRLKLQDTPRRFIALSATAPNLEGSFPLRVLSCATCSSC